MAIQGRFETAVKLNMLPGETAGSISIIRVIVLVQRRSFSAEVATDQCDQLKEAEMGWACSTHGRREKRSGYKVLV
jgi:hypothetical protein